jgi:hypothetical protein
MKNLAVLLFLAVACSDTSSDGGSADGAASDAAADGALGADGSVGDGGAGDGGEGDGGGDADAFTYDAAAGDGVGGGDAADAEAPCDDGARRCTEANQVEVCVEGAWALGAPCGDAFSCVQGQCEQAASCTPGALSGCDGFSYELRCNAEGTALIKTPCEGQLICAVDQCIEAACAPATTECVTPVSFKTCAEDGLSFGPETPCEKGTACIGGKCLSLCDSDIKLNSNVGCDYWSVDLDNDPINNPALPNQPTPEMFPHSVVISNTGLVDAEVTFTVHMQCPDGQPCAPGVTTCGGQEDTVCDSPASAPYVLNIPDNVVKVGESREFKMPVMNVAGSSLTKKGIRIQSTQPVTAYQFNPFDSENAASNDGSLLIHEKALGKKYVAVSLPSRPEIPGLDGKPLFPANLGFVTIAAAFEGTTTVSVKPRVDAIANPAQGIPQDGTTPQVLSAGQTYTFELQQYEVLSIAQKPKAEIVVPGAPRKDLTGTWIEANAPIAVWSGHQVAGVSEDAKLGIPDVWDSCCTEHLEEQLMPLEAWGDQAFCVKSKPRGQEVDEWIVVAGAENVALFTTPPIEGLAGKILTNPGDHVRVQTKESFMLNATGPIQVVQLLVSQGFTQPIGGTPGTGDPSMMIIPPKRQYRENYGIQTSAGFGSNWVTMIRPAGVPILADGLAVDSPFNGFGDGTYEYGYLLIATGVHRFEAAQPFGLMVYGYGNVTAYGYPGGMNLDF